MGRSSKYTPELRRRAVEEVLDRERKIVEVATSLGITPPETLRKWVNRDFQGSHQYFRAGGRPAPAVTILLSTLTDVSSTHADDKANRLPDLVKHKFTAESPNRLWVADVTYCSTWEGWLYVAFIVDVHARVIIGWQIDTHMRADLVVDGLDMAAWRRDFGAWVCASLRCRLAIHQYPLHRSSR